MRYLKVWIVRLRCGPTTASCEAPQVPLLYKIVPLPGRQTVLLPCAVLFTWLVGLALLIAQLEPVDVALDPGHSRVDVGAAGGGLREYQLTLALAQRVRTRLEAAHLRVRLTREDDLPLSDYTNPSATEQIQAEQ